MIIDLYKDQFSKYNMKKRVLLVEPDFPYPNRSKNRANEIHKNFAPIGLLKLGAYHKSLGNKVKLVRGKKESRALNNFNPDEILVTSLFTYWSKYVWEAIEHYKMLFPEAKIKLGGIYATLHAETPEFIKKTKELRVVVHKGIHNEAEKLLPDYSLLNSKIDHHITHIMRGCIRRCAFCGTWRIEPKLMYKNPDQIIDELKRVGKNKIIFFDNNFFANPRIKEILKELVSLKINDHSVTYESQSGYDGRLLEKDPELAILLKKARFSNVRIAWDNGLEDHPSIKKQINHLIEAGYSPKEIQVFMIYNFDIPYETMLKKLEYCKKWGVQISDCRYRPLLATYDNYKSHPSAKQTSKDYYIHEKGRWTDEKIRAFRKKVRQYNMEIRYCNGGKYNPKMEKWSAIHNTFKFFDLGPPPLISKIEKSEKIKERIVLLNRLKNHYKKIELSPPKLGGLNLNELDQKISNLIEENNIISP